MIADIIIAAVFLGIIIYIVRRDFKNCETFFEQAIYIILILSCLLVSSLYILDRFNIPSYFHWGNNINTQNWLSILTNFSTTMLAETLGGVILFFITMRQIKMNNEDNLKRDKEERRINNMPLLSYQFDYNSNISYETHFLHPLNRKTDWGYVRQCFSIKNIGMNSVRNCYVQLLCDTLELDTTYSLGIQGTLDKSEEKGIEFNIPIWDGRHDIKMIVFYEDLVHNWYQQNINFQYIVFQYKIISHESYNISEETLISEKPKLNIKKST